MPGDEAGFVVGVALEPKSEADREKLGLALRNLAPDDPPFRVSIDQESGQTIVSGASEFDLSRIVGLLIDAGVHLLCGAPQAAYRETLGRPTEVEHTYRRPARPVSLFARVKLLVEPGARGSGFIFENRCSAKLVPAEYIPGVLRGLEASTANGVLAGFPVTDFKATLVDGAHHDVDSSPLAFEIATRAAFKELREQAAPLLLQPVMTVEVTTPKVHVRKVVDDLNSRGVVLERDVRGGDIVVTALAPLANMFGYDRTLPALTGNEGRYAMRFERYEPIELNEDPPDPFAPAAALRA